MVLLTALLLVVLAGIVVLVVGAPLRGKRPHDSLGHRPSSSEATTSPQREDLEAAREAKYREIRDAELDFRTGKLSDEDYRAIDGDLRTEALQILDELERLTPRDA
jgi:hypothetical protein